VINAHALVNPDLPVLKSQDDPVHALNLMDECHVGHLAVVDNGKFLGLISETMLLSAERIISGPHSEMPLIPASVLPHEHLLEVLKTASEFHLTLIPVVDGEGNYQGAISLDTLIESLSKYQSASERGAIIVLEMNAMDYHLSQIARIVEENDARILSFNSTPAQDISRMELHLKINKEDVNPILQSFERFGYDVKASYQEPVYTEDLKRRYDELMRYLNI
jgi:acetoin utilization protein AcuB